MTIYKKRTPSRVYRKIYETHYGPIPKEPDGRSYDVHHIDGDHSNNSPDNLKAVTVEEHYNIHYTQCDYGACYLIARNRFEVTPDEQSLLISLSNKKRIAQGTHHFLGGDIPRRHSSRIQKARVEAGTHHMCGPSLQKNRVAKGTHPLSKENRAAWDTCNEYMFEHTLTGEVVTLTQRAFVNKYHLNTGNVSSLVSGRYKTTGGWKLRKDKQCVKR